MFSTNQSTVFPLIMTNKRSALSQGSPLGHEDAGPEPAGAGDHRPDQQHRP